MPTSEKFDVVIVGGGPAGSSCAVRLARTGLTVLLIEQKQFPRPKLCGEFITPECLQHFAELGVLDAMSLSGGIKIDRTLFYARSGRSLTVPSHWLAPNGKALGLSRAQMDSVLLSAAVSAGAEVLQGTSVVGLMRNEDHITGIEFREPSSRTTGRIESKLIIDATGRSRALSRFVGKEKRKRAEFVAFKAHLRGAEVPRTNCEIYSYKGGYGGCSGIEDDLHNLCFIIEASTAKLYGSDAEQVMRNVLFTNKRAKSSLSNASVVDQWLAVPIETYGRSDLFSAHGLIAIGDAAGFIDPFTGSGMLLALESSRIVAEIIASDPAALDPARFPQLVSKYQVRYLSSFDRRLKISALVRRVAFVPFLAGGVVNFLSLNQRLSHRLAKATR